MPITQMVTAFDDNETDNFYMSCDDEICKHEAYVHIANDEQDRLVNESLFVFPKCNDRC
jgi:hypothetical protein